MERCETKPFSELGLFLFGFHCASAFCYPDRAAFIREAEKSGVCRHFENH